MKMAKLRLKQFIIIFLLLSVSTFVLRSILNTQAYTVYKI